MLPPCSECGLRPRYLVNGKWSTYDKINSMRREPGSITVRPQHRRHCFSEDNLLRHFLKATT